MLHWGRSLLSTIDLLAVVEFFVLKRSVRPQVAVSSLVSVSWSL